MSRTVYEHLLRLTGENASMVRAADGSTAAIKRLDESSRKGQQSLDRYNRSMQVGTNASSAFAKAFGGISIGLLAREAIRAADSMTLLEGRLRLVSSGNADLVATQRELLAVSQDSRASIEATTSFYVRLKQRLGDVTTGSLQLSEITELVSKSLKIGGASAKETSSSLLQLSQALSSGLLRGDEFRSLSENAVGLMDAIAKGANKTQAELRAMSIEGKLTTELIMSALAKSAPEIRRQFEQIPVTVGDALQRAQNVVITGIQSINKEYGATDKVVSIIGALTENADLLGQAFIGLVSIKVAKTMDSWGKSIASNIAATRAQKAATLENQKAMVAEQATMVRRTAAVRASLVAEGESLAVKIRQIEVNLTRAKTEAAVATQTARLTVLEKQATANRASLTAATGALTAAQAAQAATNRTLAATTGFVSAAMTRLKGVMAFLGGPLGLVMLAVQAAYMFDVFGDGVDNIDLTTESLNKLAAAEKALTEQSYQTLLQEQELIQNRIKRIELDDLQSEASLQELKLLTEKEKLVAAAILQTEAGAEAAVQEAIATAQLAEKKLAETEARFENNHAIYGELKASKDLKIASDAVLAAYENLSAVQERKRKASEGDTASTEELVSLYIAEAGEIAKLRTQREGLLALQKDSVAMDKIGADGKKALANDIEELNKKIDQSSKKKKVELSVTEELEKKEADLRKEIALLDAAHKASGKEVSVYSVKLKALRTELAKHTGATEDVEKAVEELSGKYKSGEIDVAQYEKALKALRLTQAQVEGAMRSSGAATELAGKALKELNIDQQNQLKIQRISASEGAVAAEVYKTLKDVADKYGISIAELETKYPALVAQQAEFIAQREGIEKLNSAIEGFSKGLIDTIVDGESVEDFFKDLWKRMVKDFLASGLIQLLRSFFNGGTLDFSGFSIGNYFNNSGFGGNNAGGNTGGFNLGGNSGTGNNSLGGLAKDFGSYIGLSEQQTGAVLGGAAAAFGLYAGYQQITGGNKVSGAVQMGGAGLGAYNAYQKFTGGQEYTGMAGTYLGAAGNAFGIYNGIKQGGVMGYGSAAMNAAQLYGVGQTAGWWGGASQLGTALSASYGVNGATGLSGALAASYGSTASGLNLAATPYAQSLGQYTNFSGYVPPNMSTAGMGIDASQLAAQQGAQTGNGLSWLGKAGAVAGVAGGLYGMYSGIEQGGARGAATFGAGAIGAYAGTAALTGGASAVLGAMGPAGWAAMAVLTLAGMGGARDYDQILQEDYLPDLFGVQKGSAAGNNTGVFGSDFGVRGSGLNAQFLANGGANGNGGFFTGAQSSLDGFEEALRAAGFESLNSDFGTLRVLDKDKTVEDIMEVWQTYRDGLDEAVSYGEVFETAVQNGLVKPSNLFFENFSTGFGQSYFDARDSLGLIDARFDELSENGMASTDALFQSISEHYGIALEDAKYFVEQSGVSIDQWTNNFSTASDENLQKLFDFNDDGITSFESTMGAIGEIGELTVGGIADRFGDLSRTISEQGRSAVGDYLEQLRRLGVTTQGMGITTNSLNIPSLGVFSSALSGSETVLPSGIISSSSDQMYSIGVNGQESVTVNRKGMIERIESKLDALLSAGASDNSGGVGELITVIKGLVKEIRIERARPSYAR